MAKRLRNHELVFTLLKRKLSRRTIKEYEKIIRNHIKPSLGKIPITKITHKDIRQLMRKR